MTHTRSLVAVIAATAILGACAQGGPTQQQQRVGLGALAGAALGAGAGLLVGGDDRRNALVGAGIGALAGAGVGAYLNEQERQLNRDLAGTGATVQNTGENLIVTLPQDVTFAVNSAQVQPHFIPTLTRFAETLRAYPQSYIDVIGHTDSSGAASYNQTLSERRANSVADLLAARGVIRQRLVAYGVGETQPRMSNDTATGRAANRRVEVKITPLTES